MYTSQPGEVGVPMKGVSHILASENERPVWVPYADLKSKRSHFVRVPSLDYKQFYYDIVVSLNKKTGRIHSIYHIRYFPTFNVRLSISYHSETTAPANMKLDKIEDFCNFLLAHNIMGI